jgi:hypothetical protein
MRWLGLGKKSNRFSDLTKTDFRFDYAETGGSNRKTFILSFIYHYENIEDIKFTEE